MTAAATNAPDDRLRDRPGAWVDLGLTLPIFLVYHLAVVFLDVKNATDMVTGTLLSLTAGDKARYLGATLAIGVIFAGAFALAGRGQAFRPRKFLQIVVEGVVYAVLMRLAGAYVVGAIFAGPIQQEGSVVGFVMSLGAGFYEELSFRVILFGLGAKILLWLFSNQKVELMGTGAMGAGPRWSLRSFALLVGWSLVCAVVFSGFHYVGAMADKLQGPSFVFRAVLGLVLTLIYATRGFAAAVWTHALYDVWVLVFR
jgi:hypothetical protein